MALFWPIIAASVAGLETVRADESSDDGDTAGMDGPDQRQQLGDEFAGWHWPVRVLNLGGSFYRPVVSDGYSPVKTANNREHHGCDIMYQRIGGGGPDQRFARNSSEGTPNYFMPNGTEAICPRDGKLWASGNGPTGDFVVIDCGKPIAIFIVHMRSLRVPYGIQRGMGGHVLKASDVIGTVSYSPQDSAKLNHVHMEVWRNGGSGAHVDPMPYLAKAGYL